MVDLLEQVFQNKWTDLHQNFTIDRGMEGLVNLVYHFTIHQGTLPWQPIEVEKSAFWADQSSLSRCHYETGCNIAIQISKIQWHEFLCIA